jgi:hypothetical protein
MQQHEVYTIGGDYDGTTLTIPDCARYIKYYQNSEKIRTLIIPSTVVYIEGWNFSYLPNLVRIKTGISRRLIGITSNTVIIGPGTPTLKELKNWTFALHWHWKYPDRITPNQTRLFTLGVHCLSLPVELCQVVFTYIPSDDHRCIQAGGDRS